MLSEKMASCPTQPMNSSHVGEKIVFNHFSRVQNDKVEKEISVSVILFWYCKMKAFAITGPWQG